MAAYRLLDEQAVCLHRTAGSTFWPTHDEFRVAARHLMEALHIDLPRSRAVLIKPNLCINRLSPDCGINTHVGFVHGLVEYFRLRGHRVWVGEGGASYDAKPGDAYGSMDETWERSGYRAMARSTGSATAFDCTTTDQPVSASKAWSRLAISRRRVALLMQALVTDRNSSFSPSAIKSYSLWSRSRHNTS